MTVEKSNQDPTRKRHERPLSPILFLAGECLLVSIASLMAASPHADFASKSIVVLLALVAAAALLWHQAGWRGTQWLMRGGAALVVALLLTVLLQWLPRSDVFTVQCCRGGTRPGTFWPLLFVWALGLGLFTFSWWGAHQRWWVVVRQKSARAALWWLAALAWSVTCAVVLLRNVSGAVLWASLVPVGKLALFLGVPLALFATWLFVLSRRERARSLQVDAEFEAMPLDARASVLELIERAARRAEYQYLYSCVEGVAPGPADARVNGPPLARAGEEWPGAASGEPAWFLLQLPLDVPRLGQAWQGRIAVVFLSKDYEVIVRTYAPATESGLAPLDTAGPDAAAAGLTLRRLAVPYVPVRGEDEEDEDEDDVGGFDVEQLPGKVPGLTALLKRYSASPAKLLARVLAGRSGPHFTGAEDEILVGGDPLLIQGAHEPDCSQCGKRMRFLFQSGELSEKDWLFGDAGVCYVYGCDEHPERCEGFIDSH
jgi:hypothetical protein